MADTTYSWLKLVSAADPNRDSEKTIVYHFGGGKIIFKESKDPYK